MGIGSLKHDLNPERSSLSHPRTLRTRYRTGTLDAQLRLSHSFRKLLIKIAPPLPTGSDIVLLRHFRSLFHWRPTRRRWGRRHGETGVGTGIWRHRNRGKESLLSGGGKCPTLGACSFPCGALDRTPGKGRLKTSSSGEWGRRKSLPRRWKGLGVSGDLRPPPLRVYFGNGQETCFLPEVAFFPA